MHNKAGIFIALWALACPAVAWAGDKVADLKTSSGSVELVREGHLVTSTPGAPLMAGDILRTGGDGNAGVSFIDGTRIAVGPNAELEVVEYRFRPIDKDYAFDVFMKRGEAAYSSGRLGKLDPEVVKFRTPQATLGIRGTKFLVRVE